MGGVDERAPLVQTPPHKLVVCRQRGRSCASRYRHAPPSDPSPPRCSGARTKDQHASASYHRRMSVDGRGAARLFKIGPTRQKRDRLLVRASARRIGRRRSRLCRTRSGRSGSPARRGQIASSCASLSEYLARATRLSNSALSKCSAIKMIPLCVSVEAITGTSHDEIRAGHDELELGTIAGARNEADHEPEGGLHELLSSSAPSPLSRRCSSAPSQPRHSRP